MQKITMFLFVVLCSWSSMADDAKSEGQMITAPFLDLPSRNDSLSVSKLQLQLRAKADNVAGEGIDLEIEIQNKWKNAIDILNPIDFIRITLSDSNSIVHLPTVVHRFLIDDFHRNQREREHQLPYRLISVETNGSVMTPEQIKATQVHLPAGASMRIRLNIDRIVKRADKSVESGQSLHPGAWPRSDAPTVPVPPGEYHVGVTLSLAEPGGKSGTSRSLKSDNVTVAVR